MFIEQEEYAISRSSESHTLKYKVLYPSGNEYEVVDNRGMLMLLDENGDWTSFFTLYTENTKSTQIMSEGRE